MTDGDLDINASEGHKVIEKKIRDDLTRLGIVAVVEYYTANGLEFHVIFENENDMNLYKIAGKLKDKDPSVTFRISPGIVAVLGRTGLAT